MADNALEASKMNVKPGGKREARRKAAKNAQDNMGRTNPKDELPLQEYQRV